MLISSRVTGANFICGTSVRRQEQSSPKGQSSQSQCRARLIGGPTRPETGIAPTRLQSHIRRQTFLLPTPSGQYHQAKVEIIRPQSQCQHGQLFLNMDAHQRHKNTYTRATTCCASGSTSLFSPQAKMPLQIGLKQVMPHWHITKARPYHDIIESKVSNKI